MTKKDIIDAMKDKFLLENSGTPGITVTKKNLKTTKGFNDEYYKDVDKKMKDYEKIEDDDFEDPKFGGDEEEELFVGSGMEGITYDDEDSENYKKFEKRNTELNKPSDDYYLEKDEIDDVPGKLKTAGKKYKENRKENSNTPPVRTTAAESTIKRLKYKSEFISESQTMSLIPKEFKSNNTIFEMTDSIKTYKIRWEGDENNGKPVILLFKDQREINEEIEVMNRLINYNPKDQLTNKTNILLEEQEFKNTMSLFRKNVNEQTTTGVETPAEVSDSSNTSIDSDGNKYYITVVGGQKLVSVEPNNLPGKKFDLFTFEPGTNKITVTRNDVMNQKGVYSNLNYLKYGLGLIFSTEKVKNQNTNFNQNILDKITNYQAENLIPITTTFFNSKN